MIPKIIHQIWIGDKPIPEHQLKWISEWKKLYPDFEYKLWTSNDFGENKFTKTTLEKKEYAFYSDWIRANVLYTYGGIYLDTDIKPIKKIPNKYFSNRVVIPLVSKHTTSNYIMMSSKKNRFMKNLIDLYKSYNDDEFDLDKWVAPNPIRLSLEKTFGEYFIKNPNDGSFESNGNDLAFFSVLETAAYHPFENEHRIPKRISKESFCIHYWNAYKTLNNLDKTSFSSIYV